MVLLEKEVNLAPRCSHSPSPVPLPAKRYQKYSSQCIMSLYHTTLQEFRRSMTPTQSRVSDRV